MTNKILTTEISNDQLSRLLIHSFRYALGRRTYAVRECVEDLIEHLHIIPKAWLETMITDLDRYFDNSCREDECDIKDWHLLYQEILIKKTT